MTGPFLDSNRDETKQKIRDKLMVRFIETNSESRDKCIHTNLSKVCLIFAKLYLCYKFDTNMSSFCKILLVLLKIPSLKLICQIVSSGAIALSVFEN